MELQTNDNEDAPPAKDHKPGFPNNKDRQLIAPKLVPPDPNGTKAQLSAVNRSEPSALNRKANYALNEQMAVSKKIAACQRRDNYVVNNQYNCATVTFNTAAFEIFRENILQFFESSPDKFVTEVTVTRDQNEKITQDTIRVRDKMKRNTPQIYTLNIYRTTSRIMVNGAHHAWFIDDVLPSITDILDKSGHLIQQANEVYERSLRKYQDHCEELTRSTTTGSFHQIQAGHDQPPETAAEADNYETHQQHNSVDDNDGTRTNNDCEDQDFFHDTTDECPNINCTRTNCSASHSTNINPTISDENNDNEVNNHEEEPTTPTLHNPNPDGQVNHDLLDSITNDIDQSQPTLKQMAKFLVSEILLGTVQHMSSLKFHDRSTTSSSISEMDADDSNKQIEVSENSAFQNDKSTHQRIEEVENEVEIIRKLSRPTRSKNIPLKLQDNSTSHPINQGKSTKPKGVVRLYCHCKQPWKKEDGDNMTFCVICKEWLHYTCAQVDKEKVKSIDKFVCMDCIKIIQKVYLNHHVSTKLIDINNNDLPTSQVKPREAKRIEDLKKEVEQLKEQHSKEMDRQQISLESLTQQNSKLVKENSKLKELVNMLEGKNKILTEDNNAHLEFFKTQTNNDDGMVLQFENLKTQNLSLKSLLEEKEAELTQAQMLTSGNGNKEVISSLKKTNEGLKCRISGFEDSIRELQQSNAKFNDELQVAKANYTREVELNNILIKKTSLENKEEPAVEAPANHKRHPGVNAERSQTKDETRKNIRQSAVKAEKQNQRGPCLFEFELKDSCKFRKRCMFSHNIDEECRQDPTTKGKMKDLREKITNNNARRKLPCVYEYFQTNSCRYLAKGRQCHFPHIITEEMRNDAVLKKEMQKLKAALNGPQRGSQNPNKEAPSRGPSSHLVVPTNTHSDKTQSIQEGPQEPTAANGENQNNYVWRRGTSQENMLSERDNGNTASKNTTSQQFDSPTARYPGQISTTPQSMKNLHESNVNLSTATDARNNHFGTSMERTPGFPIQYSPNPLSIEKLHENNGNLSTTVTDGRNNQFGTTIEKTPSFPNQYSPNQLQYVPQQSGEAQHQYHHSPSTVSQKCPQNHFLGDMRRVHFNLPPQSQYPTLSPQPKQNYQPSTTLGSTVLMMPDQNCQELPYPLTIC